MTFERRLDQRAGQPVLVTCATGEAAARLRAEGERLLAAAHPGVVRVHSSTGDESRWQLCVSHGGRPLDVPPRLTPLRLAAVMASVADTLADLHALGVVHGRLAASHVLLAPDGHPRLCGFGPGAPDGATAADDVAAVGRILAEQLGADAPEEAIPERRWVARRRGDTWARAAILTLADQASADIPSRRPTARRLAASLSELAPVQDAPLSQRPAHLAATPRGWRGRASVAAIAAASIAVVGAGIISGGAGPWASSRPTSGPPDRSIQVSSSSTQPTIPPPRAPAPAPTAPTGARRCPGEAAACRAPATEASGRVVTIAGRAFEIGEPGDQVMIEDWDCDQQPTPALLRPSTGDVFVFPRIEAREVRVAPVMRAPGAVALVVGRSPEGCAALSVRLKDGRLLRVTTAGAS